MTGHREEQSDVAISAAEIAPLSLLTKRRLIVAEVKGNATWGWPVGGWL